jgi:FlaA1/EpsC-like NDP-sugar epimerase
VFIKRRSWVVISIQAFVIGVSLLAAWMLRFEFRLHAPQVLFTGLPILLVCRLVALKAFSLTHGYWRYTSVNDLADVLKATLTGSILFVIVERFLLGQLAFPKSIYLLEALITTAHLMGIRVAAAFLIQQSYSGRERRTGRKRVLIIGAGFAGQLLARELNRSNSDFNPVGFIDDDPSKYGAKLCGLTVLGSAERIGEIARQNFVKEVLIAVPSASRREMQRIVQKCADGLLAFRTVPSLADFVSGKAKLSELREVSVDDLLGREPVSLALSGVRAQIQGRVVMVTGAAGSIGSELVSQVLSYEPRKLVCVDQDETGLFDLQQRLAKHAKVDQIDYCVADIGDQNRMKGLFHESGITIVFHAAAYKHVPLMECNVREAVQNNVFALERFLQTAETSGCDRFVLISSDKAVNPTSFMGVTKRIGELIIAARPSRMRCVAVRFGNVLGSQGSVLPTFRRQIETEGRITITHPEISRFFMTIPEAVGLVLQSFTIGEHGDVLVLDMGDPIKIVDLAKLLIQLSGKAPEEVEIEYTGLREGEKLYEELFYEYEQHQQTSVERVRRTRANTVAWDYLRRELAELYLLAAKSSDHEIRNKAKDIVPEYSYELLPAPNGPTESSSVRRDVVPAFGWVDAPAGTD